MSAARKSVPGKSATRKSTARKSAARKSAARKSAVRASGARKQGTKVAAKTSVSKRTAAKRPAAKRPAEPVRGGLRVWGEGHPAARLTEKRVIRYRALVSSGKATVGELAAREGCSHGRISMAVRGATWQHLNDIAPPVPAARQQRPKR